MHERSGQGCALGLIYERVDDGAVAAASTTIDGSVQCRWGKRCARFRAEHNRIQQWRLRRSTQGRFICRHIYSVQLFVHIWHENEMGVGLRMSRGRRQT